MNTVFSQAARLPQAVIGMAEPVIMQAHCRHPGLPCQISGGAHSTTTSSLVGSCLFAGCLLLLVEIGIFRLWHQCARGCALCCDLLCTPLLYPDPASGLWSDLSDSWHGLREPVWLQGPCQWNMAEVA